MDVRFRGLSDFGPLKTLTILIHHGRPFTYLFIASKHQNSDPLTPLQQRGRESLSYAMVSQVHRAVDPLNIRIDATWWLCTFQISLS